MHKWCLGLQEYDQATEPVELDDALQKVTKCRKRLQVLTTTLTAIEKRLDKVKTNLQ